MEVGVEAISQQIGFILSVWVCKREAQLWGSLASCGRLAIGQLPRLHDTAAVGNRRAGCQPAPQRGGDSTSMSRIQQ